MTDLDEGPVGRVADDGVTAAGASSRALGAEPGPRSDGDSNPLSTTISRAKKLTIGDKDPTGAVVQWVYTQTDLYSIYRADEQVRYVLPDDYAAAKTLRHRIAPLGGLRASIEDLCSEQTIDHAERERAARELAWALSDAFETEGDNASDQAKQVLMRVDERLRSLVMSHYRKKYVFANATSFVIVEALLILTAVFLESSIFGSIAHGAMLASYAKFGMLGALGAFLSVIAGVKSITCDIKLRAWEHVFSGATRIMVGVIGAWAIALALDSALVDPSFGHGADPSGQGKTPTSVREGGLEPRTAMYLILSFIAGFSESLVPSILRRGEDAVAPSIAADTAPDAPIVKDMKPGTK
jgi:hypothetical protein